MPGKVASLSNASFQTSEKFAIKCISYQIISHHMNWRSTYYLTYQVQRISYQILSYRIQIIPNNTISYHDISWYMLGFQHCLQQRHTPKFRWTPCSTAMKHSRYFVRSLCQQELTWGDSPGKRGIATSIVVKKCPKGIEFITKDIHGHTTKFWNIVLVFWKQC